MLGRLGGSGWVEYLIVFILGVLCAVAISYDYSLSQFMHWDDGMWVGQSLLGQPRPYPPQPVIYVMMDALAPSLALIKVLPLIAHGLLVGAIFLLLRQFSEGPLIPGLLALTVSFYPVSAEQTFYIIGSHPVWGVTLALYALYCFWKGCWERTPARYLYIGMSGILALLATLSSSMAVLVVIAPLLWLALSMLPVSGSEPKQYRPSGWQLLVYAILLLIPLMIMLNRGLLRNVYSEGGDQQRINVSVDNVLPALQHAAELVAAPLQSWYLLILVALLFLSVSISWLWRVRQPVTGSTRLPDLRIPLMALVLSALVFAPNIAVSEGFLRSRYVVAAYIAAMVAVAAAGIQLVEGRGRVFSTGLALLLMAIVGVEIHRTQEIIRERWGGQLVTYNAMLKAVEQEKDKWPPNASVIFVIEPGSKAPAPWWTTPTVRFFSGNDSLFAMIAATDMMRTALAIGNQAIDGRRDKVVEDLVTHVRRAEGTGLEGEYPLFVYTRAGPEDAFSASPLLVFNGSHLQEALTFETGAIPTSGSAKAESSPVDLFSARCEQIDGFPIFGGPAPTADDVPSMELIDGPHAWTLERGETVSVEVEPAEGELFLLEFRIRASRNEPGDAGISRPLHARAGRDKLQVTQRQGVYTVSHSRGSWRWWRTRETPTGIEMSIYGRQGCRMVLSLNGKMIDLLPSDTMPTKWILGSKKEPYWSGQIEDWRYYRAKQ